MMLSACQRFDSSIPSGWVLEPIGKRIALEYGSGLTDAERTPGAYQVFGSNGPVGTHDKYLVEGPGILVGRKGSVGAVHFSEGNYWPIDTVYYVTRKANDDPRFIASLLEYLRLDNLNAATGVPGLTRRDALFMLGAFPPLNEQVRIAETLKAADDHIRALEEQYRKAERVKKALMQSAFPYKRETIGLPTINSLIIAPVTNGYSPVCPDYETGRWVLGLDALTANGFDPAGRKPAPNDDPKLAGNELQENDVLISRSNTRERVGYAGLYQGNPSPCFYPDLMMRVKVDHAKIRPRYLDLLLQSEFSRRFFQSRAGGTSGSMVKIKERDVRQMPVILPCVDSQDVLVERFNSVTALIAALGTQLTAARRVKQSLLQNLLTGKVRLKP